MLGFLEQKRRQEHLFFETAFGGNRPDQGQQIERDCLLPGLEQGRQVQDQAAFVVRQALPVFGLGSF